MQVRVNQSVVMRDGHVCTVLEEVDAWLPRERGYLCLCVCVRG